MKEEKLFEMMADINENYVSDAHKTTSRKITNIWMKWAAVAACLCITAVAVFSISKIFNSDDNSNVIGAEVSEMYLSSYIDQPEDVVLAGLEEQGVTVEDYSEFGEGLYKGNIVIADQEFVLYLQFGQYGDSSETRLANYTEEWKIEGELGDEELAIIEDMVNVSIDAFGAPAYPEDMTDYDVHSLVNDQIGWYDGEKHEQNAKFLSLYEEEGNYRFMIQEYSPEVYY